MNGQRYGTQTTANVTTAPWARDQRTNPYSYGTQSIPFDCRPTEWYAPQTATQARGLQADPTLFGDLMPTWQAPLNVLGATRFNTPSVNVQGPPAMGFLDTTFSSSESSEVKLLPSGMTTAPRRFQNYW